MESKKSPEVPHFVLTKNLHLSHTYTIGSSSREEVLFDHQNRLFVGLHVQLLPKIFNKSTVIYIHF